MYKRQVLYDRHSLAVSRKLFTSVEEYIDDHYVAQNDESYGSDRRRREYVAVSYTHLDVYKRQVYTVQQSMASQYENPIDVDRRSRA